MIQDMHFSPTFINGRTVRLQSSLRQQSITTINMLSTLEENKIDVANKPNEHSVGNNVFIPEVSAEDHQFHFVQGEEQDE